MNTVINIGPLAVPVIALIGLLAGLAGFGAVSVYCHTNSEKRKYYFDRLLTGVIIFVLAWRLSPAFIDFKAVAGEPMFFLYAPTGPVNILIGLTVFLLYGLRIYLKDRSDRRIIPVFLLFVVVSASVFAGIRYILPGVTPEPESGDTVVSGPPVPGKRAPDFSAEDLSGASASLSDYAGKPVILNFWATWCPPCKAEIPELVRLYRDNTTDAALVSVNMTSTERDVTSVKSFVLKENIDFPVLLDLSGSLARLYGVSSIPTTFIIDTDGTVRLVHTGAVTKRWLENVLEK